MKAFGNALLVLALSLPNARGLAQSAQSAQRSTTVAAVRAVWAVGDGDKIAHDAHPDAHRLAHRFESDVNGREGLLREHCPTVCEAFSTAKELFDHTIDNSHSLEHGVLELRRVFELIEST